MCSISASFPTMSPTVPPSLTSDFPVRSAPRPKSANTNTQQPHSPHIFTRLIPVHPRSSPSVPSPCLPPPCAENKTSGLPTATGPEFHLVSASFHLRRLWVSGLRPPTLTRSPPPMTVKTFLQSVDLKVSAKTGRKRSGTVQKRPHRT